MGIMPVDLRLNIFIRNPSIGHYRLGASCSTLNLRLVWGPPRSSSISITIFPFHYKYYPNHLFLVANLPKSPCINTLPLELDFAAPVSRDHRARHGDEWRAWIASIGHSIQYCPSPPTIFPCGRKSSWNCEDDRQPTVGIAINYIENREVSHTARAISFKGNRLRRRLLCPGLRRPSSPNLPHKLCHIHPVTNHRPHADQSFARAIF